MTVTPVPGDDDWLSDTLPPPPTIQELADSLRKARKVSDPVPPPADDDWPDAPQGDDAPQDPAGHGGPSDASGDASPGSPGAPPGGKRRARPSGVIWSNCPVIPLGVQGDIFWYLDALGQLRAVKKHDIQGIKSLFHHRLEALFHAFPKLVKDEDGGLVRKRGEFDANAAANAMITASGECRLFSPDRIRGRGAWADDDGNLIWHAGDRILHGGDWRDPGRIEAHIYPAAPALPTLTLTDDGPDPVEATLEIFRTWGWRDDLAPLIALGMLGCMMVSGALRWRPVFWVTAGAGSGKSEFLRLLELLLHEACVKIEDATAASVAGSIGQSSLPAILDETEPDPDNPRRIRELVELARIAASGGKRTRSSSSHEINEAQLHSVFLFSSILIPGTVKTQDWARMIVLALDKLPEGTKPLRVDPRAWRTRGDRLRARIFARWPQWEARLSAWRAALELAQVTGRNADNWAPVMAMQDLVQFARPASDDEMAAICRRVAYLADTQRPEIRNDAEDCVLRLLSSMFSPIRRDAQWTVAQWVQVAACLPGAPLISDEADEHLRAQKANRELSKIGMRVYGKGDEAELFVINTPIEGLCALFNGSRWQGGAWSQSLQRVPGAYAPKVSMTLSGINGRGWKIPLRSLPGLLSLPADGRDPGPDRSTGYDAEGFA